MHHTMLWNLVRVNMLKVSGFVCLLGCLTACNMASAPAVTIPPTNTRPPAPTDIPPTATTAPSPTPAYPWVDASAVMAGICFEAAADAAGRTFVIRSADELATFFDLADNSGLCRLPVERADFDFSDGRVIAGTWSRGDGCSARHTVDRIDRDDDARTLTITLRLVTEGDCAYELVRPFWVALDDVTDYAIEIVVN